ncbi:TPM domain-containing protein [Hoyosella sp. G463]|uniref:TPM domain-containing protein n=1 Tax=Lolliginicoccus lacisalsi TaxID=2742202 RepID=A0A927JAB3_9ACTN|nr:TPM domain-containing protein [Lolliginicoccus lacisalsi]MBD8505601.1 TPM domain-containing protein [Lolliginicoccus lacisalsi]
MHRPRPAPRTGPRRAAWATLLALLLVIAPGLVLAPGLPVAQAEQPFELRDRITDNAGVLAPEEAESVREAMNGLSDAHGIRLWVVFTDSFSGIDAATWTDSVAELSRLGDQDVVLAVAVGDREYYLGLASALTSVSSAEEQSIARDDIEPHLAADRWAAAALGAVEGLERAVAPSTGSGAAGIIVLVAIIAGGAVLVVLLVRRRRSRADQQAARLAALDLTNRAVVAQQPVTALEPLSRTMLVDTDNAISSSAEELARAADEFGDRGAAGFRAAVDAARNDLARAFQIRQQLDTGTGIPMLQRHAMLVDLVTLCARADAALDEQVEAFDAKRDLLVHAPDTLDAVARDIVTINVRLPEAEKTLATLKEQFAPEALATIITNPGLARDHVQLAESASSKAHEALGRGDAEAAVSQVRAAESAVSHANALIAGVENAENDIRAAIDKLPAAMADLDQDIAEAHRLGSRGGTRLAEARARAEAALAHARRAQGSDPLGSMKHIVLADDALDDVLAEATENERRRQHAARALANDLAAAKAHASATRDYISTRRGAVSAQPRTKLSEAMRHLADAEAKSAADPVAALNLARAAMQLAQQALAEAQNEVRTWEGQQQRAFGYAPGGGSTYRNTRNPATGAVLGGVLGGALAHGMQNRSRPSRAARPARRHGRTAQTRSFGGPRTSGRRGTGGRF